MQSEMKSWFGFGVMVLLLSALIMMSGCKGGLFGGPGQESGTPRLTFNQNNFYANANSSCVQGSAGAQVFQPNAPITADAGMKSDETVLDASSGTGKELAAEGSTATVNKGLMVQNNTGSDGMSRSADVGVDAALQALAGNTQTTAGQSPTTAKKESTATGAPATISPTNERNPALQMNPNVAATGQGTAQVANPTSTLAGASSQPGAVTGGVGDADGGTAAAAPQAAAATAVTETVETVTANADGTRTVTTASGRSLTGQVMGPFGSGTESVWVLLLNDGTPVRLAASGAEATALGQ